MARPSSCRSAASFSDSNDLLMECLDYRTADHDGYGTIAAFWQRRVQNPIYGSNTAFENAASRLSDQGPRLGPILRLATATFSDPKRQTVQFYLEYSGYLYKIYSTGADHCLET